MNRAQKHREKSDAAVNAIFNNPFTVDSKLIKLETYASGEIWFTVVLNIADNNSTDINNCQMLVSSISNNISKVFY